MITVEFAFSVLVGSTCLRVFLYFTIIYSSFLRVNNQNIIMRHNVQQWIRTYRNRLNYTPFRFRFQVYPHSHGISYSPSSTNSEIQYMQKQSSQMSIVSQLKSKSEARLKQYYHNKRMNKRSVYFYPPFQSQQKNIKHSKMQISNQGNSIRNQRQLQTHLINAQAPSLSGIGNDFQIDESNLPDSIKSIRQPNNQKFSLPINNSHPKAKSNQALKKLVQRSQGIKEDYIQYRNKHFNKTQKPTKNQFSSNRITAQRQKQAKYKYRNKIQKIQNAEIVKLNNLLVTKDINNNQINNQRNQHFQTDILQKRTRKMALMQKKERKTSLLSKMKINTDKKNTKGSFQNMKGSFQNINGSFESIKDRIDTKNSELIFRKQTKTNDGDYDSNYRLMSSRLAKSEQSFELNLSEYLASQNNGLNNSKVQISLIQQIRENSVQQDQMKPSKTNYTNPQQQVGIKPSVKLQKVQSKLTDYDGDTRNQYNCLAEKLFRKQEDIRVKSQKSRDSDWESESRYNILDSQKEREINNYSEDQGQFGRQKTIKSQKKDEAFLQNHDKEAQNQKRNQKMESASMQNLIYDLIKRCKKSQKQIQTNEDQQLHQQLQAFFSDVQRVSHTQLHSHIDQEQHNQYEIANHYQFDAQLKMNQFQINNQKQCSSHKNPAQKFNSYLRKTTTKNPFLLKNNKEKPSSKIAQKQQQQKKLKSKFNYINPLHQNTNARNPIKEASIYPKWRGINYSHFKAFNSIANKEANNQKESQTSQQEASYFMGQQQRSLDDRKQTKIQENLNHKNKPKKKKTQLVDEINSNNKKTTLAKQRQKAQILNKNLSEALRKQVKCGNQLKQLPQIFEQEQCYEGSQNFQSIHRLEELFGANGISKAQKKALQIFFSKQGGRIFGEQINYIESLLKRFHFRAHNNQPSESENALVDQLGLIQTNMAFSQEANSK